MPNASSSAHQNGAYARSCIARIPSTLALLDAPVRAVVIDTDGTV